MKSLNSQLQSLYSVWKNGGEHFVDGGVVDQSRYTSGGPKMMILLKEPNDPDHNNWTLIGHVHDQIAKQNFLPTFKPLGIWSYGLQNSFPWYDLITRKSERIVQGLLHLAVTNLKNLEVKATVTSMKLVMPQRFIRTYGQLRSKSLDRILSSAAVLTILLGKY